MKKRNRHLVARLLDSPRYSSIAVPLLSILLSVIVSAVLLLLLGKNPLTAYGSFLRGCGILPKAKYGGGKSQLSDFFVFLNLMAPMLLASLAFIVGSRAGLFNIGISGQMLLGGYLSFILVGYSDLGPWAAKPLVILIGIVGGGLLGALVGFLKYRFNIHEVVSTILINYIVSYLTGFSINGWHVNMTTRTMKFTSAASRMSWTNVVIGGAKCSVPLGLFLAIIATVLVKFLFDRTVFGFELQAVGMNNKCARYTGIKVGSRIVWAMLISGMLAGLAGVCYYLGYTNTIVPKTLSSMGYDSIAVALLGNSSPVGVVFASFLITVFQNGTTYMSSSCGVPREIADLIIGILLLFSACGGYFKYLAHNALVKDRDRQAALGKNAEEPEKADGGKGEEA